MARWKLLEAHYLNSPESFWEQTETDRETGKQRRKRYLVPLHLDPKVPQDWNYRPGTSHFLQGGHGEEEGAIIVCWEGKGQPRDIVFTGDPTQGMEPLDDEAKEISQKFIDSGDWLIQDANDNRTLHEVRLDNAAALLANAASKDMNADLLAMQKQMMEMMAMMAKTLEAISKPMMDRRV